MKKTAIPSSFPVEGIYSYSRIHVDLSCATPGSKIYYTINDDDPTEASQIYHRENGLIPLPSERGQEKVYTIAAFAQAEGFEPSRVENFVYRIIERKHGEYHHQMMQEPDADHVGIIRIEDYDKDKMFLLIGSKKAILIDAGYDAEGDLPRLCMDLIGDAIPLELIVAHGHPDHIAQLTNFLNAGYKCFMPHADIDTAKNFVPQLEFEGVHDIKIGDTVDLGNAQLKVYAIPGHTPGGIVLFNEDSGDIFSSDEFGSNRRYVPDSAWLQLDNYSIESCYNTIRAFFEENKDKMRRIFTGHNDDVLDAETYLSSLLRALKNGLDSGESGLVPSLRSASESFGSGCMVIDGNWRVDSMWNAANVKFLYDKDKIENPPHFAKGYTEI